MPWGDGRTGSAAWKKLRRVVLDRDRYRCTREGCTLTATDVDHVVPKSKGGSDHPSNLTSLCAPHHREKSSAEGNAARWGVKRPVEPHPGLLPPPAA